MYFVYTPDGMSEPKLKVPFEPAKMLNVEAEQIEKRTGMSFPEWSDAVMNGSMRALHGLIFVLLKRTEPTLLWDQVQFSASECDFEMDDDEMDDLVATLRKRAQSGHLTDEQVAFLEQFEASRAAGDDEPEAVVDEVGVPVADPTELPSTEDLTPAT